MRLRAHRGRNLWQAPFELRGELGVARRAVRQLQVGVALVAEHELERLARRAAVSKLLPVPRREARREGARRRRGGATCGHAQNADSRAKSSQEYQKEMYIYLSSRTRITRSTWGVLYP